MGNIWNLNEILEFFINLIEDKFNIISFNSISSKNTEIKFKTAKNYKNGKIKEKLVKLSKFGI